MGPILEMSREDWEWLVGVNSGASSTGSVFYGPPDGRGRRGPHGHHRVGRGVDGRPDPRPVRRTKHAVVGLSETLYLELAGTGVGVSVVCLVWCARGSSTASATGRIASAARTSRAIRCTEFHRQMLHGMGIEPAEVADRVASAVLEDRFWVLPHDDGSISRARASGGIKAAVERRRSRSSRRTRQAWRAPEDA